ncbi:MAG: ACT domain-containing protein [Euryarchaeota archaeon]|nr:ACT domain-containing protein [Euryarchaeota archaeon]
MVQRVRQAHTGSVAEEVRSYIDSRPVVRDAVAMGIVNLSALTRKIMQETGISQEEAVLVACRRYESPNDGAGFEAGIRDVLKRGNLEVRTHAALLNVRPSWDVYHKLERTMSAFHGQHHPLHVIQGSDSLTIITDEGVLSEIEEIVGEEQVIKRRTQLVELNLRVPEESEMVPGIVAFLTSSLASRGINVLEVISVYKDNMFLIEEDDLFEAFGILNGLIRN